MYIKYNNTKNTQKSRFILRIINKNENTGFTEVLKLK